MISIEESFYSKFPRLAEGAGRVLSQPMVGLARRIACEDQVNTLLANLGERSGLEYVEHALELLGARYQVALTDRENIPAEGRVVIVANHPLGAVDALALLHLVGSVRRDAKFLVNDILLQLKGLAPLLVPCDVFGGGQRGQLRAAYRCLEEEQALIVFPAGEVSRLRPNGVRDGRWSDGFLRFARRCGAPVLPVHIAARNSPTFYGVSMLAKPLVTLMLPREMFASEQGSIIITVGAQIPPVALFDSGLDERHLAQRLRAHVYRLAKRKPPKFVTSGAIAHPENPQAVRRELARAERLGATTDGKQILLLDSTPDNAALREIGRLRELSFRKVGEGTGLKRDLDRYDPWYRHIVLWDEQALEIAGAYRLGEAWRIVPERGLEGLYSASLFEFSPAAREVLAAGLELGRSFVHPRHWGSRSLDYLWQGIGAYLRTRPEVRYLLGPVSLSISLGETARAWIVHYYRHYYRDAENLACSRNPYRVAPEVAAEAEAAWAGLDAREGLARLKQQLDALDTALPTLYRQYVDLCDPEGIRFLDFGVDPGFGHCVDGLICLDMQRFKPGKRSRYLESAFARRRPAAVNGSILPQFAAGQIPPSPGDA